MAEENAKQYIQALVWYEKKYWQELRNLFTDTHLLPKTFEEWQKKAEENFAKVKAGGDIPIKVFIEPEQFAMWCKKRKKEPNAEARTTFAIEVVTTRQFGDRF